MGNARNEEYAVGICIGRFVMTLGLAFDFDSFTIGASLQRDYLGIYLGHMIPFIRLGIREREL